MALALYRKIAAELRRQIVSGEIPPGERLPSEPQMVEDTGASRNTIRLAIAQLVNEGLVTVQQGRGGGTFVRTAISLTYHASRTQVPGPESESDAYTTEVRAQGRTPTQDFQLLLVPAPGEIAERLEVDEGATVVLRRCHRFVDGQPTSIQDTFYPRDLADEVTELLNPVDIERGTTYLLAQRGHRQVAYRDELVARMPTPEETHLLELPAGTPVVDMARTGYTKQRPVRVTRTVFASDRNRIVYESGDPEAITHDEERG